MDIKDTSKLKMEAQLNEFSAHIILLEAKAENAGTGLRMKYANELIELRTKQQQTLNKFEALVDTSEAVLEQVKESADHVWGKPKTSVTKAQAKSQ